MTGLLKQRLIGAIVLISLGIIFIPMLLTGKGNLLEGEMQSNVPPKPMYEIKAPEVLPLDKQTVVESSLAPVAGDNEPSQAAAPANTANTEATAELKSDEASRAVSPEQKESTTTLEKADAGTASAEKMTTPAVDATNTAGAASKTVTESGQSTSKPAAKPAATPKAETQVAKIDTDASGSSEPAKPIVSGYVVQLGSFSVEKNATSLRDKLRSKGYASFVESYQRNGKTSYRVRVGPELTPELAEKLKEKLKAETKLNGLVMAFPGK